MISFSSVLRYSVTLLVLAAFTLPAFVGAQVQNPPNGGVQNPPSGGVQNPPGGGVQNPSDGIMLVNPLGKIGSLQDLIMAILKGVIQLGAIFLVLMLVFVGFKFVMAQGNEEELRSARAALLWTIIGGLILLGSQAIMSIVQDTANSLR